MNAKTRFKKILEFKKQRGRKRIKITRLIEEGKVYETRIA